MINLEYHKGSFCIFSNIFCQEGYCSGCEIYLRRMSDIKPAENHKNLRTISRRDSKVVAQTV